jgi:catechol 2,3-dioxygenase-like lactoylglutathione lyase family enzyme
MIRVPPDLKIELFQWTTVHQRTDMPSIADIDAHHIGIQVSDIDSAVAHLEKAPGVALIGGINEVPAGRAGAGIRFVYFRAPWGLNLELLDYSKASATHGS